MRLSDGASFVRVRSAAAKYIRTRGSGRSKAYGGLPQKNVSTLMERRMAPLLRKVAVDDAAAVGPYVHASARAVLPAKPYANLYCPGTGSGVTGTLAFRSNCSGSRFRVEFIIMSQVTFIPE